MATLQKEAINSHGKRGRNQGPKGNSDGMSYLEYIGKGSDRKSLQWGKLIEIGLTFKETTRKLLTHRTVPLF